MCCIKWHFTLHYTHTHPFNGPLSRTTWVSWYQKCKTNLDFTEARDSEWHWHQLGHMQVCTSLQTDNHASTLPLSFLQAGCPSCHPTNSDTLHYMCTVMLIQHGYCAICDVRTQACRPDRRMSHSDTRSTANCCDVTRPVACQLCAVACHSQPPPFHSLGVTTQSDINNTTKQHAPCCNVTTACMINHRDHSAMMKPADNQTNRYSRGVPSEYSREYRPWAMPNHDPTTDPGYGGTWTASNTWSLMAAHESNPGSVSISSEYTDNGTYAKLVFGQVIPTSIGKKDKLTLKTTLWLDLAATWR